MEIIVKLKDFLLMKALRIKHKIPPDNFDIDGPIGRSHVTLHKIRKRGCRHVGVPFSDNIVRKEHENNGSMKERDNKSFERVPENCNLLSEYAKQLDLHVRKRYLQKIFLKKNSSQNVYHQLRQLICCQSWFWKQATVLRIN